MNQQILTTIAKSKKILSALQQGTTTRQRALAKWGPEAQIMIAVEEAGELIQAAMKELNRSTKADLAGEVADSLITVMGVAEIIGPDAVAEAITRKTERLAGRL
jgi:NTP pyrophosphatase (non-canonical NTP hydrolase)